MNLFLARQAIRMFCIAASLGMAVSFAQTPPPAATRGRVSAAGS